MNGKQLRHLERALIAAFPSESALARMVRYGLDERLETITQGTNLEVMVFELLRWAEAHGKLDALKAAALEENPDNPALQELALSPLAHPKTVLSGSILTGTLILDDPDQEIIAQGKTELTGKYDWVLHLNLYLIPQMERRLVIFTATTEVTINIPNIVQQLSLTQEVYIQAPYASRGMNFGVIPQGGKLEFESPLVRSTSTEVIMDGPGRLLLGARGVSDRLPLPTERPDAEITICLQLHHLDQPIVIASALPRVLARKNPYPHAVGVWQRE